MMRPSEGNICETGWRGEHLEMVDWMLERASATDKSDSGKGLCTGVVLMDSEVLNRRVPLLAGGAA